MSGFFSGNFRNNSSENYQTHNPLYIVVTLDEIQAAIGQQKRSKAAGPDGLQAEAFIHGHKIACSLTYFNPGVRGSALTM